MPSHKEERYLPYSPAQMFDLVADIGRYPEFLPWCVGARIHKREGNVLYADLMVGFKLIRERFTSKVTLAQPDRIEVEYLDGPFRYLKNQWLFREAEGGCRIDFYIEFEFRSRVLRKVMQPLFQEAVRRMVASFESRARALYGEPCGAADVRPV
jgi:coenzyme Q-binding protein COQ10